MTALLRGAPGIALGDMFGSSLVDSTLSIGAGPLVFPPDVTPRLAGASALYSLVAVVAVGAVLTGRRRHDRASGFLLFALYAISSVVLLLKFV